MSGRIRSIKPEWLDDERLAECSDAARVLSIGLLLEADDHGNGRAWVTGLAGRVFPGKPREVLSKALDELRDIRYVLLYEVDGQHYFAIRNWAKHQKVDHPGKPKVPGPSAGIVEEMPILAKPRETLALVREIVAPDQEGKGTDRKGEGGESEGNPPKAAPAKPAKKSTRVDPASDWSPEQAAKLRSLGRDVSLENEAFIAHHESKGTLSERWSSTRATWIIGAKRGYGAPARQTPPGLVAHAARKGLTDDSPAIERPEHRAYRPKSIEVAPVGTAGEASAKLMASLRRSP